MTLITNDKVRDVKGISYEQKKGILDFLQGAVYCWCKNNKGKWFSMRELMGGDNFDWKGTPLIELYNKHIELEKKDEEAIKGAGIDSGWLLKEVIHEDLRQFETRVLEQNRQYRWLK